MQTRAVSCEQLNSVLCTPELWSDQCSQRGGCPSTCWAWLTSSSQPSSSPSVPRQQLVALQGPQTGGWPCPASPLCVQLWCCNEIDAFPQIIFPWKQSRWLLWRSYWWIGGSHLGDSFRNTCSIHEHKAKFTTWNSVKCCLLRPYSWCADLNPESG